jgi:hypothetical protein
LKLRTLAEIATIVTVIIVILQYLKVEPNVLDHLTETVKKQATSDLETVEVEIKEADYLSKNSLAFSVYKAALLIPYSSDKSIALNNAVDAAIDENDFKLAIAAANSIPYASDKSIALKKIAYKAMEKKETLNFSIIAADLIPYASDKSEVLGNISKSYELIKSGGKLSEFLTQMNKPKDKLDEYKEIYKFADSSTYMGMSEIDAKKFTDNWQKSQTYEDFLLFKDVFIFADSSTYMSFSTEQALTFSIEWIEKYNTNDFLVYKDAFMFADSGTYMDMSETEAISFAISKVEANRKANKKINKDT